MVSLVWSEEALVTVLEEKGILTRGEVLAKIKEPREAGAGGVHPTL